MTGKLLPCPFCEGEGLPIHSAIHCQGCGTVVRESDPQRAALLWNTRSHTDPIGEKKTLVEALTAIVQVVADADSEDAIGSLDIDIPSGGYPRQWLRNAARFTLSTMRNNGNG